MFKWPLYGLLLYLIINVNVFASEDVSAPLQYMELTESFSQAPLFPFLSYLKDSKGQLTIDDVSSEQFKGSFSNEWKKLRAVAMEKRVYWIRFEINNLTGVKQNLYLQQSDVRIDDIRFYRKNKNTFSESKLGYNYPFSYREIKHPSILFELSPKPGLNTYYLRYDSEYQLKIELSLWRDSAFLESAINTSLSEGLLFGMLIVIALYNLFLWSTDFNKNHLYLSLFVTSFGFVFFNLKGLSFQYFWHDNPDWINIELLISNFILVIAIVLYTQSFLRTEQYSKVLHRILNIQLFLWVVVWLSIITIGGYYPVNIKRILSILIFSTVFFSGFATWRGGRKPAIYFLVGMSLFIIEAIILSYQNLNQTVSQGYKIQFAEEFLAVVAFLFFSYSVTDEMKRLKKGQEQQRALSLKMETDYKKNLEKKNRELESKVLKRTRALKASKEKAEESNELKSIFLANMSHEFRTPLHGILSYSQIGKKHTSLSESKKINKYFSNIEESGKRLLKLVTELLDFSKIDSGKLELNTKLFDMIETINDCINEQLESIKIKQIKIIHNHKVKALPIDGDELRLRQVFTNLLSNAIKFTPIESTINISIDDDTGETIKVSVTDEGVGIPEKELSEIFSVFSQSSLHRKGAGGTGLGLSISREIIEAHGGKIVAINNIGEGATVSFDIPKISRAGT